jgi:hypothetical protein
VDATLRRVAKTLYAMWQSSIVESVCEVLADTNTGLTGSEIGRLLAKLRIRDIDPDNAKRHRLSNALLSQQQQDQAGNCIVRFIAEAMAPGLHFKDRTRRQNLQDGLNERLALMGLKVRDDGRIGKASQTATTVDEAVRIAGRLRTELTRRGTMPRFSGTARRNSFGDRSSMPSSKRRKTWPNACASSANPGSTAASW